MPVRIVRSSLGIQHESDKSSQCITVRGKAMISLALTPGVLAGS